MGGGGGGHKHKIMDRPFKTKYGTVSQVLLQLVVAPFSFLLVSREENAFSALFKNYVVNQRQRHQVI